MSNNTGVTFNTADTLIKNIEHFTENAMEREAQALGYIPDGTDILCDDGAEHCVDLGTSKRSGRYHEAFSRQYTRRVRIFLMICLGFTALSSIASTAILVMFALTR